MLRKEKGFTLIELMIVVAIIGILAAIAIPNFLRFQAKSRQGEAKSNLGAIFTAMEAFAGQYDSYTTDLAAVGWAPTGTPRYIYGFTGDNVDPTGGTVLTDNAPGGVPIVEAGRNSTAAAGAVHCGCPDSEINDDSCGEGGPCYSSGRMVQSDGTTDLTADDINTNATRETDVTSINAFVAGAVGNIDRDVTLDNWQVDQSREVIPACTTCDDVSN